MSLLSFAKKITGRQPQAATAKKAERKAAPRQPRPRQGQQNAPTSLAHARTINLQPWVTEKGTDVQANSTFVFRVRSEASKGQIAAAVREQYAVTPLRVRTLKAMPKTRRRGRTVGQTTHWKKAYVTLPVGQTIEF
jgi:large subunit ribosomal protein L23